MALIPSHFCAAYIDPPISSLKLQIIKAPHPEGLSIEELRMQLDELVGAQGFAPLQEETLHEALKTLTRHDVIQQREERWQIIVELFRRWVLQN